MINDDLNLYGVVEIGSRGVRMLVAGLDEQENIAIKESLGREVPLSESFAQGHINNNTLQSLTQEVVNQLDICHRFTQNISIIATQSLSGCDNFDDLQKAVPKIEIDVMDQQKEGTCSFVASLHAFRHQLEKFKSLVVIDFGGSTTEIITGAMDKNPPSPTVVSLNLGSCINLPNLDPQATYPAKIIKMLSMYQFDFEKPAFTVCLGSTATDMVTSYLRLNGIKMKNTSTAHGVHFSASGIDDLINQAGQSNKQFLCGMTIIKTILNHLDLDSLVVSRQGVRFGYLLMKLGANG